MMMELKNAIEFHRTPNAGVIVAGVIYTDAFRTLDAGLWVRTEVITTPDTNVYVKNEIPIVDFE